MASSAMRLIVGSTGVAAVGASRASLVRVPVKRARRDVTSEDLLGASSLQALSSSIAEVVLTNQGNTMYYGDIEVGTPGETMSVVFDTGSADLWLPVNAPHVDARRQFDAAQSSTFQASGEAFSISYGSGSVSGGYCRDIVTIGDLSMPNFTFAAVNNTMALRGYRSWKFDGVLGLGFRAISVNKAIPTALDYLTASGQLAESIFGFYLGDDVPGELVIGGVAPEHIVGDLHFVNVTQTGYWSVALDEVRLGSMLRVSSAQHAIIDSGSSFLLGPQREVRAFAAMLGAIEVAGVFIMPCQMKNATPQLSFMLNGMEFALDAEDLFPLEYAGQCVLGMQHMQGRLNNTWILGNVFMRKFYVAFDFEQSRIGFATASRGRAPSPLPNNLI